MKALHETRFIGEGLTYDDVLLVPAFSEVLPKAVEIKTRFTRNISLNAPIVAAAMDTVSESAMAIAIAREGGIAVLHKNMSVDRQAQEIRKVKRSESGMILDPVTLYQDACVVDAKNLMREHKIGGIPVVDKDNKLIGIVTNRDLRFEKDDYKDITEVMTQNNLITTNEETTLAQAEETLQRNKIEKLPVVNDENQLVGLITFRDIIKIQENPNSCKDQFGRLRVAAAVGASGDVMNRVEKLHKAGVDAIVLDSAHGHHVDIAKTLVRIKKHFPELDVVAGNIATPEAAKYLAEAGADAVKVGIGPGSICTTRVVAGVGVPQLTAVMNVADALKDTDVPVIADGGVRFTGDIAKALAGGASSVMLGSLLAGTEEAPGDTIIYEGRKYKAYRGMGSIDAMKHGSKDRYFQGGEDDVKKLVPEGIVGRVAYKGTLKEVMYQFIGGLRASMGYCGAPTIEALKNAKFVRITAAGIHESHPHDVSITKEAPNYSR
ncbi:MAG: IMP dehydrogenase [Flavobacteriales bacterium]|jgi:IMP dehydrogenase|nr:IMP dehydrogenase [Flavobacteriales bacterium]